MAERRTEPRDLDRAVETLQKRKDAWASLLIPERLELLRQCMRRYLGTAAQVAAAGCAAKGIDPRSPAAGEEWLAGPVQVLRNMRLLVESLSQIHDSIYPALPDGSVTRTPTGELAARVFPNSAVDRLLFRGTFADVWMQPGVDEAGLRDTMAVAYHGPRRAGAVALVLGAGNVASIGPMDVLYKMFVENRVVVLKMHPVNDYLGPLLERAFEPLIAPGYLRVAHGDAAEGQHLVHHPGVDEIHLTGSLAVHDRIVWGDTPEEQKLRRAASTPKVTKRITSELGCVTPVIVVPGAWSDADLQYQAANIATMMAHSASCTCTSAKVLITWRGWPQRQRLLEAIDGTLSGYPARTAYYPGAAARYGSFLGAHPQARTLYRAPAGRLAPATIYGIDPSADRDIAFCEEAWSPVLAETRLDATDEEEFLDSAVRFCNDRITGTLSVDLIVDPAVRARLGPQVDRAIAALRYGTVAINHWSAVSFGLAAPPWGAYPGHTLEDAGSGIGFVHNTFMFERPLKTVLSGPFRSSPAPPWFITHRRSAEVGRRMAAFEASPSLWRLPGIVLAAVRP